MVLRINRSELEEKFYTLCEKVVVETGLALYDVDYNGSSCLLRLFIYQPQSMTADLDDCVRVDGALTPYFEEQESWVPEGIRLEISSPGVFRFLRQVKHFEWAKGKWVKLKLNPPFPADICSLTKGQQFRGRLQDADETGIKLEIGGKIVALAYSQIKRANLDPDLNEIV